MASIPQNINPTNAPSYLNESRGTDRPQVNTSSGEFLSNLGKNISVAAEAADKAIVNDIKRYVRTGVEEVRDDFGINAATEMAAQKIPPTTAKGESNPLMLTPDGSPDMFQRGGTQARGAPAGVAKLGNNIRSLDDAYKAGMLSESYYLARLNNVVQQAKQAYGPGYWDDIDSVIQKQTGIVPANALRSQMVRDLDAAYRSSGSAVDKQLTYLQNHAKYLGDYGPTAITAFKQGKVSFDDLQQKIIDRQIRDYARETEKADVNDDAAIRETKAKRYAGAAASSTATQMVNDFTKQSRVSDLVDKANQGIPLAIEEEKYLINEMANLERRITQSINQKFYDGKVYENWTDGNAVTNLINSSLAPLKGLQKSLGVKDYGAFARDAYQIQRMEERDTIRLQEQFPNLKNWAIVTKQLGPAVSSVLLNSPDAGGKMIVPLLNDARRFAITNSTATGRPEPLSAVIPRVTDNLHTNGQKAQFTIETVRDHATVVAHPEATPDERKGSFEALYGKANSAFLGTVFNKQDYRTAFLTMYNPAVTETLKKDDPQRFFQYGASAMDNASVTIQQEARTLAEFAKQDPRYKVYFDPASGQLTYEVKTDSKDVSAYERNIQNRAGRMFAKSIYSQKIENQIANMNSVLGLLKPIIEADGRADVASTMQELFRGAGIEFPEKPEEKKE